MTAFHTTGIKQYLMLIIETARQSEGAALHVNMQGEVRWMIQSVTSAGNTPSNVGAERGNND